MKNLHLIPTDKLSRLYLGNNGNFVFGMMQSSIQSRNDDFTNQNIFITSDEEIKEGDWCLSTDKNFIIKQINLPAFKCDKKIILTTDQDLIADGVQEINDEFLEWFVKNPSCEEVKTETYFKKIGVETDANGYRGMDVLGKDYKIIIPNEEERKIDTCYNFDKEIGCVQAYCRCEREESKQEPLEEAAENYGNSIGNKNGTAQFDFISGAKWQQEKMYSEEELKSAFKIGFNIGYGSPASELDLKNKYCEKWFEQFKKK